MKKTLTAIILSLAAAATLSLGMAACGNPDDGTPAGATSGLAYTLSDDGTYYTLSGIGEADGAEIIIPETYRDLPVTAISGFAFQNCDITAVTIPASITTIGTAAFTECTELAEVTFEGSELESLGDFAFGNCTSLTEIALPDGIPAIGSFTFSGCNYLTTVTIPASVTEIRDSAFNMCNRLATINYRGSRTQWAGIDIADQNEALYEANINYNS